MSKTPLKSLSMKRKLNEGTRKQAVWLVVDGMEYVFSLHIVGSEVIITDNTDYTKILSVTSLDFYHLEERSAF